MVQRGGSPRFPAGGDDLAFSVVEQLVYEGEARVWHHRAGLRPMARPHSHADLEVNLVIEGTCSYVIDGRRVSLRVGTMLFLHAGEDHLLCDASVDHRMWLTVWRPRLVRQAVEAGLDAAAASERPSSIELRQLPSDATKRLARLFADVAGSPHLASGPVHLLWRCREEFAAAADVAVAAAHPAVVQAARLLRVDPGLSLAEVAEEVGLSSDRLGRVFLAQTGLALVDYRSRIRLERLCAAWQPGADLLTLALAAGFGSYSAFNRAFRVRYGCPPRDFLARAAVDDQLPARHRSSLP